MPVITLKDYDSANMMYEWWCPACSTYHYGPDCPRDDLTAKVDVNMKIFIGNDRYVFCPCCGQLVKASLEGI